MSPVTVAILLHPGSTHQPLTALLRGAQRTLAERHARLFRRAGAEVRIDPDGGPFGERLGRLARWARRGLVVLGGGAVPLLTARDAERLVVAAAATTRLALTNNRYSSDVCAIAAVDELPRIPPLAGDNALPRWLADEAGWRVDELPGRRRLALDLDTPLDLALVALARRAPAELRAASTAAGLAVPRLDEVGAVAADTRRELLVFGRSSAETLAWLERNVACRVRFLAEERGLRASASLGGGAPQRPPRATLGRLLDRRGPEALASTVAELADAAVIDSRVLLADRLGADEAAWPSPEDRFASDLLRPHAIVDPWLRALTASAAGSRLPILLGGHTLVGPGLQLVFNARLRAQSTPPPKGGSRSLG